MWVWYYFVFKHAEKNSKYLTTQEIDYLLLWNLLFFFFLRNIKPCQKNIPINSDVNLAVDRNIIRLIVGTKQ